MNDLQSFRNLLFTYLSLQSNWRGHGWHVVWTLSLFFLLTCQPLAAPNSSVVKTLSLSSGEEITLEVFGKNPQLQILWIASTPGIKPRQRHVAENPQHAL